MTDQEDNLEELEGSEASTESKEAPKELRQLTKKQGTKIAELEKELAAFKANEKTRALADALTAKGVNPKVAKFLEADGVEGDEAIVKWLTENEELLVLIPSKTNEKTQFGAKPNATVEEIEASKKFQNLGSKASSPSSVDDANKYRSATTIEEARKAADELSNSLR